MITIERMRLIEKGELQEAARKLSRDDIPHLVEWLALKVDAIRYQAFLLFQKRSQYCNYEYVPNSFAASTMATRFSNLGFSIDAPQPRI